jgi:hypothetical protein
LTWNDPAEKGENHMLLMILGFSISDRAADYIPSMDGYRPGARQDLIALEVDTADLNAALPPFYWVEAAYQASNLPPFAEGDRPVVRAVRRALDALRARYAPAPVPNLRSLSVGDTITMAGQMWECTRTGWVLVDLGAAAAQYVADARRVLAAAHGAELEATLPLLDGEP